MIDSNVGQYSSIVTAEHRLREKNLMGQKLTDTGRALIAYLLAIASLFAVCTAIYGVKFTLLGFAIFHLSSFLAVGAVCWQGERQWSRRSA
jgi:hypothetical protein